VIHVLSFEARRLFATWKHILVFWLFFLISLYLCHLGLVKYRGFFHEKESFIRYEKQKVQQYVNYEQYGAYGFRVLYDPAGLGLFHPPVSFSLTGAIDTTEIVDISLSFKGRNIFSQGGNLGDFSCAFYVFGSLLMLYFGLNTFISRKFLVHTCTRGASGRVRFAYALYTVFFRLILLLGYFAFVIASAYGYTRLMGVRLSGAEGRVFLFFSLYTLLFLCLFYLLGILCSAVFSFKKILLPFGYAIWFLAVFLVPEVNRLDLEKRADKIKSNEAINITKLNNVMDFERKTRDYFADLQEKKVREIESIARQLAREYSQRMYDFNRVVEDNLREEVDQLIHYWEEKSVLLPSSFYRYLSRECSGCGYVGYRQFLRYILDLKERFFRYYMKRRYDQADQGVIPFVEGDENIFYAAVSLPDNYLLGTGLTLVYSISLLLLSLYLLQRKLPAGSKDDPGEEEKGTAIDLKDLQKGRTYFSLCPDAQERKNILNHLCAQGAALLDPVSPDDIDPGISLRSWVLFECGRLGLKKEEVISRLEEAGFRRDTWKARPKALGAEVLNRVYLEMMLVASAPAYLFNDFLKGVSRDFEKEFKKILHRIKYRIIILYIGTEMFELSDKEERYPAEDSRFFILDLENVSLR